MTAKPGICQRPECNEPKVPGRGAKFCAGHRATAAAEKIERRKNVVRLGCQFPGCDQPKLRGAGERFCGPHKAESRRRQVAESADRMRALRAGLSVEEYTDLLAAQGGVCAICGEPPSAQKKLGIDHDHSCCPGRSSCSKCRRALLCDRCNPMLGYAQDKIQILEAGIAYLRRYQS